MTNKPHASLLMGLIVAGVLLSSCGIISDKKIDYKRSGEIPSLEVPPPLTLRKEDDMALPPAKGVTYSDYSQQVQSKGTVSRATGVLSLPEAIRLERSGDSRWLVVKEAPEALWPKIRQFWQNMGFAFEREEPTLGILQTKWAENRANIPDDIVRRTIGKLLDFAYDSGTRDRYKTRLERGIEAGTTEIYISHEGMEEVPYNNTLIWRPRRSDAGLEAEMLKRLMVHLGATEEHAQQSVASAAAAESPLKIAKTAEGTPYILYPADFAESWRQVGLALDRAGFTIEDRNRSEGNYYVRYVGKTDDKGGFFSKLAFWRNKESEKKIVYRVHVVPGGGGQTPVRVESQDEQAVDPARAEQILQVVLEHLR